MDATLVPMLANLADKKSNSGNYGGVYALQQISVCLAYSFGPLLGGEAVRVVGFPWLMRLSGFLNIAFCPLLLELGEKQVRGYLSCFRLFLGNQDQSLLLIIFKCFRGHV